MNKLIDGIDAFREWTLRNKWKSAIVFCVFAVILGSVAGRASATTSDPRICNHDPDVCTPAGHVKMFNQGKLGHVNGMGGLNFFAGPDAKEAAMRQVAKIMPTKPFVEESDATCANAPDWACPPARGGTQSGHQRCMASVICRAYNRYGETASAVTCIGVDQNFFHPSCNPYRLQHPSPELTKKEVQVGLVTTLCGSLVIFGVVVKENVIGSGLGGSLCVANFWRDVDPG